MPELNLSPQSGTMNLTTETIFLNLIHIRSPGIDSKESIPSAYVACAGTFKQSMGAWNQVGIGLLYRPARLYGLAESIPGLLKSLKIPSLAGRYHKPYDRVDFIPAVRDCEFGYCSRVTLFPCKLANLENVK
jgi:hypothetical protein